MDSVTGKTPRQTFVFGQWILQSDGNLVRCGRGVHLPPKELQVLRLLLGSAGRLVTKDRLLDSVWPGMDAAEESLTRCIYVLRKLLEESKGYIATVYGKGYRFTGPVVPLLPVLEDPLGALPTELIAACCEPWSALQLADTWLALSMLGLCDRGAGVEQARAAVARVLELEAGNHQALARLALVTSLQGCAEATALPPCG
ncbi:winged helix-turn-helix domain-containing protein [Pseudomonas gingeri]|uniref:Winged helix-turn-helix domain-containing protein n=1 Tax=Pseudomonas gingeri TaxID=117681 RepID=A0A7Y8BKU2_9PSED|nr:winged helix-turn-helix domain-containing protein [Pseudomonas gingeri]NWB47399.1 winged helix-turn-helix domain-containing protein [Pseudomonas gingeri]